MIVLTKDGRVQWLSSRARGWLATYFGPTKQARLPDTLRAWLNHQEVALDRVDGVSCPREPLRVERDGTYLLVRHLCEADCCLLLLEERQTTPQLALAGLFGLTRREVEVLYWVAKGKTNAEIGLIIGARPRTVQKHLERIFQKLGVETRTVAARFALTDRQEP